MVNKRNCHRFGDNNKLVTLSRKAVTIKITTKIREKTDFDCFVEILTGYKKSHNILLSSKFVKSL